MKKTIFFIMAIGFATSGIFAQSSAASTPATTRNAPRSAAERAIDATNKIAAEGKLTEEQKGKVLVILNDYYSKHDAIMKADAGKKSPETKAKINDLKNSLSPKFQGVLTADQMSAVKTMYSKPESNK